jgi:hypothetical protein
MINRREANIPALDFSNEDEESRRRRVCFEWFYFVDKFVNLFFRHPSPNLYQNPLKKHGVQWIHFLAITTIIIVIE